MKRRCNICLVSKQHNVSKRHNPDVTICHECEMIIKRIANDDGVKTQLYNQNPFKTSEGLEDEVGQDRV